MIIKRSETFREADCLLIYSDLIDGKDGQHHQWESYEAEMIYQSEAGGPPSYLIGIWRNKSRK
jgi:hypothetical protein